MDISQQILSDITVFNKYARYIPEIKRREDWDELCDRNMAMHIRKYPQLREEIKEVYKRSVRTRKVLPSMRSIQFGGLPIELSNSRINNCAFTTVDDPAVFGETFFNLLSGSGVGYSVQKRHVEKLPVVQGPTTTKRKYLVSDDIEGWGNATKQLFKAYFHNKPDPVFDLRAIRKKGAALITSGGKAPGPEPLRICLELMRGILNGAIGRKLTTLECHDILCHISDSVLAGGIRRAACIALFDFDDMEMMTCKTGSWWELNPQRGRANNSVVLHREHTTKEQWDFVWERVEQSGCGEPGIVWTNNYDWGVNPCAEISLRPNSFCNLTTTDVSNARTQEELNQAVKDAAFLGTIQAGYTDFHYLRPVWKETSEEDSLIGVSMTGIGSGKVLSLNLTEAAEVVKAENKRVAALIGIKPAKRTSCIKPEGTASLVVGSSSGIGAWHNGYYIRRMRVGKSEALYKYMVENFPSLVEDCKFKPHIEAVMSFPQKAPEGSILRTESAFETLERVKKFSLEWVKPGHVEGDNMHNVSCTISVKDGEWEGVGEWMWNQREVYTGISVLPYDGGTYVQAPFEDCTKEQYEEMMLLMKDIDLRNVIEEHDNTTLTENVACAGGACTIT